MDRVDLEDEGWLSQLLAELRSELSELATSVEPVDMSEAEFAFWTSQMVDGLPFGFDDTDGRVSPSGLAGRLFLAGLADMARIASMAAGISGRPFESATVLLDVAIVFAALVNATDAMRELGAVRHDVRRGESDSAERVAALKRPLAAISEGLMRLRLDEEHALVGRPFHRLLTHVEGRATAHLARRHALGQLDEQTSETEFARNMIYRTTVIESVVALVCVDGRVNRMESRLVHELIGMARLDSADSKRLLGELAAGEGAPISALVDALDAPADRRELLKMVIFAALVDDELSPLEEDFYDDLAVALQIDAGERVQIFGQVARAVAHHPGLIEGLKPDVLVSRARRSATRHVEQWFKRNGKRVAVELKETGHLVALLARWTHEELDSDEHDEIREQIMDIVRSAPALALFAAPGGSLLIPVLAKVLPFSIAPSSFKGVDQDLVGP